MPPNISFRDVAFTDLSETVQIIVTTDIACHLFCRLTLEKPRIHIKTGIRRGYSFAEDLRFCFVVYDDNEQLEPGDTFTHTWFKPSWGYCITKYCYFWGYVSGEVAVSTSPPFSHHNTRKDFPPPFIQLLIETWTYELPPPPPMSLIILETWDSISPTFYPIVFETWSS